MITNIPNMPALNTSVWDKETNVFGDVVDIINTANSMYIRYVIRWRHNFAVSFYSPRDFNSHGLVAVGRKLDPKEQLGYILKNG